MGLLDSGPLSSPDAQIMLAAGLLGGRGNLGANLGQGLLGAVQAQQQERANRASDLQQLQGLYKIALQNDQLQASYDDEAGRPHVRDPNLTALEAKMAQLSGMPALANQGPVASRVPGLPSAPQPQGMPPAGTPQGAAPAPMPGMAPPSASPMANPDYQPSAAEVQQRAQANAQQVQQQVMTDLQAQMAKARRQGDRYAIMGFPTIAQERYKLGMPALSRGVSFNPATGLPIGGFVDNVPVQFDAQGRPTVIQSDIPQAIAQRKGMETYADQLAKSYFNTINVPGANRVVFASDYAPGVRFNPFAPSGGASTPNSGQPPQPSAPSPGVATVTPIPAPQSAPNTSAPRGFQGGGISGPDPVALARAESEARGVSEQYAKAYGEFRTAAAAAPQQRATLEEMRQLANNALNGQTGATAAFKQKLGEWMISAGVSPDDVNKTLNINVPSSQEFVKLALQRAMQQTRTMGAREAASVFQTVQQANPNMGLTTEGINKILAPLIAEQEWNSAKFNAADEWMAQKGTLAGFESNWNKSQSFSKFWRDAQKIPAQDPNAPESQNMTVDQLVQKYRSKRLNGQ